MSTAQMDDKGIIAPCPSCGQRNRTAFAALETRCGKCRTPLPPPREPIEVPGVTAFEALVGGSPLPVVVDFWAPWCGPCRTVAPELVRVASGHAGRIIVAKVNTDQVPELGERFRIRSIPTLAVFLGGNEVGRQSGAMPAADIEAFIRQTVA